MCTGHSSSTEGRFRFILAIANPRFVVVTAGDGTSSPSRLLVFSTVMHGIVAPLNKFHIRFYPSCNNFK